MCSPNCSMGTGHRLTGANSRLSLPHRRYSVPETVMRKYSLSRQKSAESVESGTATVPTPSVPSARTETHPTQVYSTDRKRSTVNKACQTSPRSSLVSSTSFSSCYKSAIKKQWDHTKKANSLDETTSKNTTDDSQLYFDSNYRNIEKYKSEILREISLPGEVILEKEETTKSILISKSDEINSEEKVEVEEENEKTFTDTNNYIIEEDIKVLLENITKDMTIKLLLGFRAKSFPEKSELDSFNKSKHKREIKSANGRLVRNETIITQNEIITEDNSTLSNIRDITQFEDTPSPEAQESPPQENSMSPPKSGHSSDQSAECYITDCDICAAEGRKCCSLDNSSEVFSFTSPDMVMTTNELKTSSEFTSTSVTLDQTVTDRSTSTQDSTLSITSITPESYNSSSTESKIKLTNNGRITPSSVGLVINSETTVVQPIRAKDKKNNVTFHFTESSHSESSDKSRIVSDLMPLVITSECIIMEPVKCDNAKMHYVLEMMETDSTVTDGSERTQIIEYSTTKSNENTETVTIEIINKEHSQTEVGDGQEGMIGKEDKMYDSLEINKETSLTESEMNNDVEKSKVVNTSKLKVLNIFLDRNVPFRQSTGSAIIEGSLIQDSITRSMSCGELANRTEFEYEINERSQTIIDNEDEQQNKTEAEENVEEESDLLEELGFKEELKSERSSSSFLELCGKKKELSYEEMCKKQVQDMFYGNRTYEVIPASNVSTDSLRRNIMGNVMSTSEDSLKSHHYIKKPLTLRQDVEVGGSNVSFTTDNMTDINENDGRLSGYTISQQEMVCNGKCNKETDDTQVGNVIMLRIPLPTGEDGNPIGTCIEGPAIENHGKELIIPRYSAMPRTVSMVVNTSSADYSSDSELSLADSLEDVTSSEAANSNEQGWANKHDSRMVRGDVTSLLPENKTLKREQTNEAYAYFVSLSGEMGEIKSETIPETLKQKLMKRDSEIRRHTDHYIHPRRKERKQESLFKKTLKKKAPPLSQSDFYDSSSKEDVKKLRKAYSLTSGDSEERLIKQDSKSTQWEEFPESFEKKQERIIEEVDEESIIEQQKESRWRKYCKLLRTDPDLDKVISEVLISSVLKEQRDLELDEKIKNILLEALKENEEITSNGEQVVPTGKGKKVKSSGEEITEKDEKRTSETKEPVYKSTSVQTAESSLHNIACPSFEFCDLCHENNLKEDKCYENGSKNENNRKQTDDTPKETMEKYDPLISNNLKSDFKEKLIGTSTLSTKNQQKTLEINIPTTQKKIVNQTKLDKSKSDCIKHKPAHAVTDKKSPRSHSCLNNKQPIRLHNIKVPQSRRCSNTLGVKFQQKFEAIPEEKSGSVESSEDQQKSPNSSTPSSSRRLSMPADILLLESENSRKKLQQGQEINKNIIEEKYDIIDPEINFTHEQGRRHTIHGNIRDTQQEELHKEKVDQSRRHTVHGNINVSAGQLSGTRRINLNVMRGRVIGQRGNVMIGRFQPVSEETQVEKDENEKILIGEIERIRRKMYKGKEALETAKSEEQEELLTLSKGWINFYLLRESVDFGSDLSYDEEGSPSSTAFDEVTVREPISRTVNVVGKPEDKVHQYTVQIRAAEEPSTSHTKDRDSKLPNLSKGSKRSPRSSSDSSDINLPGIPMSSPVTSPTSTKSRSPTFSEIAMQQSESLPQLHSNKRSILTNSKIKSSAKKYITTKKEQKELTICSPPTSEQGYNYLHLPSPPSEIQSRSPNTPCQELSSITASSSTGDSQSESPVLPSIKWPMRQVQRRHVHRYNRIDTGRQQVPTATHPVVHNSAETCWTVTVAGNSGNPEQPPPDVEMRLSFQSNQKQQQQPPPPPPPPSVPQQHFIQAPHSNTLSHSHMSHETKERKLRRAIQEPNTPTPLQPCWSLTVKNKNQGEDKEERRGHHERSSKRSTKPLFSRKDTNVMEKKETKKRKDNSPSFGPRLKRS
ncbi:uncharacterized protein LOC142327735 isoform X2 [Lycorma delicatula]|uniref:uncharacterized protein LOC142327735 isoform X2 n=1 Tax=Lycorma delicatula TaxID=130591 RepID=UPI003F511AAD